MNTQEKCPCHGLVVCPTAGDPNAREDEDWEGAETLQDLVEPDGEAQTNYGPVLQVLVDQLNMWSQLEPGTPKGRAHAKLMAELEKLIAPARELDALVAKEDEE